jgi:hypothetical protein
MTLHGFMMVVMRDTGMIRPKEAYIAELKRRGEEIVQLRGALACPRTKHPLACGTIILYKQSAASASRRFLFRFSSSRAFLKTQILSPDRNRAGMSAYSGGQRDASAIPERRKKAAIGERA